MEKIIEERLRKREEAIEKARRFVHCVSQRLRVVRAWLFGSYARGDFSEWSDIDVLIVVDEPLPRRVIDRLSLIQECLEKYSDVELVLVTTQEFEQLKQKRNPIVLDIEQHGIDLLESSRPSHARSPIYAV